MSSSFCHSLLRGALLSCLALTSVSAFRNACFEEYSTRVIHEFPNPTWLENVAVMRNGSILTTEMTKPRLWLIDPSKSPAADPELVHDFGNYLGALGVVEIDPDVFAVVSGNFSLEEVKSYPGTYTVWSVDFAHGRQDGTAAVVKKIADVPQAAFLNGISYLGPSQRALLLADSDLGVVFRMDLVTGKTTIAVDDPLMKKCSPGAIEGINGLKVHDGHLYFSNAYCGFLAKLPIHPSGTARGRTTIIGYTDDTERFIFDDMAISRDGTIFAAQLNRNTITKFTQDGVRMNIIGDWNSTEIAGPTALAFGRGKFDKELYVVTGGGLAAPINGTVIIGGQVLALERTWRC